VSSQDTPGGSPGRVPVQLVSTQTSFVHLRLCLSLRRIPRELRKYAPLFQELLYETDLAAAGDGRAGLEHAAVARGIARDTVYLGAGVGTGNSVFSASSQRNTFTVFTSAESHVGAMGGAGAGSSDEGKVQWCPPLIFWSFLFILFSFLYAIQHTPPLTF
jgi:hypothetical protein